MKYEYQTIRSEDGPDFMPALNNAGKEGWELVCVTVQGSINISDAFRVAYFKREVKEKE